MLLSSTSGIGASATACPSIYVTNSPRQGGGIPTVAEFAAGANGNVAPTNSIGGPRNTQLITETGIVQDANGFTYVGNGNTATITVYPPGASGDVAPVSTLAGSNTGLNRPEGMVIQNGKLYVADGPTPPGTDPTAQPPSAITVYQLPLAAGADNLAPVQTITGPATGMFEAVGLALDAAGDMFVANLDFHNNSSVTEYAPNANGNAAPIATIAGSSTMLDAPEGLAIDAGRLYAANDNGVVTEYALPLPAGTDNLAPVATISGANTGLASPIGLAFDAAGDLYVVNLVVQNSPAPSVTEYAPRASGNATPIATIVGANTTLNNPQFVYIAPCSGPSPLSVTTSSLTAATVGTAYSQSLVASGGTTPYSWSLSAGTLPAGLSLSSAGVISGTPTTTGTSNFTVQVNDASNPLQSASKALSLTVGGSVGSPLKITTTSPLPAAKVGVAYSKSLAATGGTAPYSWSLSAGTLPAGLSLSSAGVISGTPTTKGTSNFTARVSDASNPAQSTTTALSLTVAVPLKVATAATMPGAKVGVAYSASLAAKGGTPPYSWSLAAGTLPAGLTLSNTGVISGTPTTAGTFKITVKVTDSSNPALTAKKALTLVVS
jgi:hypothetical protein